MIPMKTSQTLRFKYKLPLSSAMPTVFLTLATTAGLGYITYMNPDVGMTRLLAGMFSPEAPRFFYWVLTALSSFASLIVLWLAIRSQSVACYLEVGPTSALVPNASLPIASITIPYRLISKIRVTDVQGQQIAILSSSVGESRLLSTSFAAPGEFTAFLNAFLNARSSVTKQLQQDTQKLLSSKI